jgi:2-polyprenyl-3-methyl-5-hydroxy-6-metoxy-1,4-benzoquinol methylase
MTDFDTTLNCKICKKKGSSIYQKKYTDIVIISYFKKYYGKQKFKFFKNKLENVNFDLIKCNSCKFIWQKNSPNEKFSYDLYDKIIDKKESLIKSKNKFQQRQHKYKNEINFIINQFHNTKVNILDFGAGWGHWLNSGDKLKFNPYALEMSYYRKKYISNLGIKVIDYDSVGDYKNFFHFIRLDQVVEHLSDFKVVFELIKKLATKDCIFYLSVPDGESIIQNNSRIKIEKGAIQPLEHLNCFSRYSLIKLLLMEGFEKITLFEIIYMHVKSLLKGKICISLFLRDIKDCFFSTSIKFRVTS